MIAKGATSVSARPAHHGLMLMRLDTSSKMASLTYNVVLQRGARYRFYWTPKIGWDGLDTVEVGLHDQDDGTETYYFCSRELESETGRPEDNELWIRLDTVRDESHSRWPAVRFVMR